MSDMKLVVAGAGGRMGRTLVKAIAERHGGHVEAVSSIGAGSTFMLHLPLARAAKMTPV